MRIRAKGLAACGTMGIFGSTASNSSRSLGIGHGEGTLRRPVRQCLWTEYIIGNLLIVVSLNP